MKYWFVISCSLILSFSFFAQKNLESSIPFQTLEEAALLDSDSVFHLDLSKSKLDSLPISILKFKNLRSLNLDRNKLQVLPQWLNKLPLEYLSFSKNKFEGMPIVICSLTELRTLKVARNKLLQLPTCINNLTKLETLDLFDTQLQTLPKELSEMKSLRFVDLRGQTYAPSFVERWDKLLEGIQVEFDPPCNCLE